MAAKKPEALLKAIRERFEAEGVNVLAREFGVYNSTVWRWARRLGLKSRADREAYSALQMARNTSVDQAFFDAWSQHMAYVLGYTFADGNVSKNGRQIHYLCHQQDADVLHGIRKVMQSVHQLTCSPATTTGGRNNGPRVQMAIASRRLVDALAARGVHPEKTYRNDPFPDVPEEFLVPFVRGFFDGDGIVSIPRKGKPCAGFVGSQRFIETLQARICQATGLPATAIYYRHSCCSFQWQNATALEALQTWLYPFGVYLHGGRKRRRLAEAINWFRSHERVTKSGYHGVSLWTNGTSWLWHACITRAGITYSLGYFHNEHEAAFSLNCCVPFLSGRQVRVNRIPLSHLPSLDRQEEIRLAVSSRITAKILNNPL